MIRIILCFLSLFYCVSVLSNVNSNSKIVCINNNWAFEENKGQIKGENADKVLFFAKQSGLKIFLLTDRLVYQFEKYDFKRGLTNPNNSYLESKTEGSPTIETYRMDMELINANINSIIQPEGKRSDYTHYYNHNCLFVNSYNRIVYKDIYPNIDWVIYIESNKNGLQRFKYDFIVHKGGNPNQIKFKTKWAERAELGENGNFKLECSLGNTIEKSPVSYQNHSGTFEPIKSKFKYEDSILSFEIESYNKGLDLIIDPELAWSTYYGGESRTEGKRNAVDQFGNVYMAGSTYSETHIASGGHQINLGGSVFNDAFIAKFDKDGHRLWATYYGGDSGDEGLDCCTDANGNVYLTGTTYSQQNIAFNGFKNHLNYGGINAFLVKFDAVGVRKWATYYGFSRMERISCAYSNGRVIMAGSVIESSADSNISFNGFQGQNNGASDGFVVSFDTLGNRLWATYYGGNYGDYILSIDADSVGNIFAVGYTHSSQSIATPGSYQSNFNGSTTGNGFIVKFNSQGTRQWGTYIRGTSAFEGIEDCTVDPYGNILICGRTTDATLFTIGSKTSYREAFLGKFNTLGQRLWIRPYYDVYAVGCTSDKDNNSYLIGSVDYFKASDSLNYKGFGNYRGLDCFIVKFDTSGKRIWSSYYGGQGGEHPVGISCSKDYDVYVSGVAFMNNGYVSEDLGHEGFQMKRNGSNMNAFLMKICQDPQVPEIALLTASSTTICESKQVVFTTQIKNGGITPQYIWKKNGQLVGSNQSSYTTNQLSDKDSIECWMVSSAACIAMDTAKSNKLVFTVIKPDTTYARDTVCEGEVYQLGNQRITGSGYYQERLQDRNGCDSLVILQLWFKPRSYYSYSHTTTCAQPDYFFNGALRKVSGVYKDTLKNSLGCDSIITLNLTVKKPSSFTYPYQLCMGDSVLFGTHYIRSAGDYQRIIPNTMGCDSTITMRVTLLTPIHKDSFIQACPPYFYKGKAYDQTTQILDTVYSVQGCDSIYWKLDVQISPKPITRQRISHEVCDTIRIGGRLFYSSFDYIDTIRTQNALRCDSIYQPIRYTIYETPSSKFYERTKDTFLRGQVLRLRAGSAQNYLWSTGHTAQILEYKIVEDAQLYLITWNHTLCRDTNYLDLWAFDPIVLDFPTGFNPQSLFPENRYFKPNYTGKLDALRLDIYNRLGEKVYSSQNAHDLGWDGTYKNQLAPSGVYSYILEYTSFRSRYIKTGEVMLVR